MKETIGASAVQVNYGELLENQLKKWHGGRHHPRGIAEYISNSDDSYRRLGILGDCIINVEVHSRSGKQIDQLIIEDFAEGMSFKDLEGKFFKYFESFSGRKDGFQVTGRFGTGGKAYAIMNFRHCWIESVKDGLKCKAWFKWDYKSQTIIRGYDKGGFKDEETLDTNGTRIILENSLKNHLSFEDFIVQLEKLARIRHILKSQKVSFQIKRKKGSTKEVQLLFAEPDSSMAIRSWKFELPEALSRDTSKDTPLTLRYFEEPLGENAYIDLSDGISSVSDLLVSKYDGRPFSRYVNGECALSLLVNSTAVKENRRGLEEGDDITEEIEDFIRDCVGRAITEIEDRQRKLDKERKLNAANQKLNELSNFLSEQDLKFKLELKELRRRFSSVADDIVDSGDEGAENHLPKADVYRRPTEDDSEELLVKGTWATSFGEGGDGIEPTEGIPEFVPNEAGEDFAVKVGAKRASQSERKKIKQGIRVLMSNDTDNPESPFFSEFDEPVSDRDMIEKGIIWINSKSPVLESYGLNKDDEGVKDEYISNLVLMVVAQYYAQKEGELQPEIEEDSSAILLLFRKHYFNLQSRIRKADLKNFGR